MKSFITVLLFSVSLVCKGHDAAFLGSTAHQPGSGGGGSPWVFVNRGIADIGGSGGTSSTFDTSGCTGALFVGVHYYSDPGATPISDNQGNSYTLIGTTNSGGTYFVALYKCASPTVGTGHTFTTTANLSIISWMGFSGGAGAVADGFKGNSAGLQATLQPGSITPLGNNDLFVIGWTFAGSLPTSINSSFDTPISLQEGGNNLFAGMSYKIKSANSTAENPTVTIPSNDSLSVVMGAVK